MPLYLLLLHLLCVALVVGDHVPTVDIDAESIARDENTLLQPPRRLTSVKAKHIAAGGYQSALISENDELYYWGLVAGKVLSEPTKAIFPHNDSEINTHIVAVSLGGYHIMALDSNGRVYTWGRGTHHALGHGTDVEDKDIPTLVGALSKRKVKLISAGYAHSIAVTDAGVYVWGTGRRGQLGTGNTKDITTPKILKIKGNSFKRVSRVCTGGYHSAILTDEGDVYTFGANDYGNLGHGNTKDTLTPTKIESLTGVDDISCGGDHMLALSNNRMLYTWGWGEKGQLGGGTTDDIFVPQELDLSTILIEGEFPTSVSAGGYATSFITTSLGRLFAFGWGEYGMLGDSTHDNALTPKEIQSIKSVNRIAAGYKHALALTQSNEVFVFGENTFGQLGLQDLDTTHVPEQNILLHTTIQ